MIQTNLASSLAAQISQCAASKHLFLTTPAQNYSYSDLQNRIAAIAHWLEARQPDHSGRIFIAAEDPFVMAGFALTGLITGRCVVPVAPLLSDHDILDRATLNLADIIVRDTQVVQPHSKRSGLRQLWRAKSNTTPMADVVNTPAPKPAQPQQTDTVGMIYTSGSTGIPKGVLWSAKAVQAHLRTYEKVMGYGPRQTLINPLPFYHTDGFFHSLLVCAWTGMTLARPAPFAIATIDNWSSFLSKIQDATFVTVPTMLDLLKTYGSEEHLAWLSGMRQIVSSAEHLDPVLHQYISKNFAPVINIYGSSETVNGGIYRVADDTAPLTSIGNAIDMQACVLDESGTRIYDTPGRLCLKGENLADGYETRSGTQFLPDLAGWFLTADMAVETPTGILTILGRFDAARNRGGVLVNPAQVDTALREKFQHITSYTLFVQNKAHAAGDALVCFVTAPEQISDDALTDALRSQLSKNAIPDHFIRLAEIPKLAGGKTDRQGLLALATDHMTANVQAHPTLPIADTVIAVACNILKLSPDQLTLEISQENLIGWDSFGHINLSLALEREFGVRFTYDVVAEARTLGDFVKAIERLQA